MNPALRLFLVIGLILAALSGLALVGGLYGLSAQDSVRLFVDGQRVHADVDGALGWLSLTVVLVVTFFVVFLIVPLVVVASLVISAAGVVIGLAAALSPLLLLGALAWWIIRRQPQPASPQ